MLHSDWLKYFKLWFRRNYRYKRFKWRRFRIWTVKFEQILNFYHFFPKYWPPRAVKSHYSSTLLNRTRWFRWIFQWWTVHFDTLIYSEGPSTFSRMTVYFDPWPSTIVLDRPLWLKWPSSLAQDRPLLDGPSTFARPSTLRTVHFHPFGPSTLDLTRGYHRKWTVRQKVNGLQY